MESLQAYLELYKWLGNCGCKQISTNPTGFSIEDMQKELLQIEQLLVASNKRVFFRHCLYPHKQYMRS